MISVGIDVSKGKSTVCFFKPGGEIIVTPFEIAHTKGELNALADKIISYGEEARVVLENTGYYHWSVVKILVERGIFVSAVNPLKMKKFCAQNIRKVNSITQVIPNVKGFCEFHFILTFHQALSA